VTDATRPCPDHQLVPGIVSRLLRAKVPESGIRILVAVGMHRASTRLEKIEKLGLPLVERFPVLDSEPLTLSFHTDLGTTDDGVPIRLDRRVIETDLLVSTGIVEPHQYAGFSGGWKTVAIGAASAETIGALHGMKYLEDSRVRLCSTENNPFLRAARIIGERSGLRFAVNVALNSLGRITSVVAGHPETVHSRLSGWVRETSIVPSAKRYPMIVGAAGHPKDSNLYQATRIATYICLSSCPVVSEGGVIIIPAVCAEGAGQGPAEKLFLEMLSDKSGPEGVLEKARREGYGAGGQRAVMVAWALQKASIAFVGTREPAMIRSCGFEAFDAVEDAVSWGRELTGTNQIAVIPRALTTIAEFVRS
jgi:nickel-dependent lactate racemase